MLHTLCHITAIVLHFLFPCRLFCYLCAHMVSLWQIFLVFAKIGAFTIGGGYAMIPLIQDELTRRRWISEEELPDIIAIAQSAPGLLSVNVSIFAGYKLKGLRGSVVATLGSILPAFVIILVVAVLLNNYQDNPVIVKIFKGIRPVVVSLIAVPMVNMARSNNKTWWAWAICIVSMLLVAFLNVSAIYVLIVVIVLAFAVALYRQKEGSRR